MASSEDCSRCEELLEEFHTVCDPQATTCPANNTQSFQLSIQEVHESVNAPEKLVFSNMTLFDGLEAIVNPFEQPYFTDQIMAWYESQPVNDPYITSELGLSKNCDPVWLVYNAAEIIPYQRGDEIRRREIIWVQGVFNYCRNIMIAELNRIEHEWNGNVDFGVLCQSVSYEAVSEFGVWFSQLSQ